MFTIVLQDEGTNNLVEVDQVHTEAQALDVLDGLAADFEADASDADEATAKGELDMDGRLVVAQWFANEDGRSLVAVFEQ